MDLKAFFQSRLVKLDRQGNYSLEGVRGFLAQELADQRCGYDIRRAHEAAEEYLVGVLMEEKARIYTMSIP